MIRKDDLLLILLFLSGILLVPDKLSAQENIRLVSRGDRIFEVHVIRSERDKTLSVRLENSKIDIIGDWTDTDTGSVFLPAIPLQSERKFLIYENERLIGDFFLNGIENTAPEVLAFYPNSDTVPANLLKCYVRFSKPMSDISLYKYLKVQDDQGRVLENVILPLRPVLWNKDNTLLTLWIDPGRVKRDLIRNKKLGAPFQSGRWYSIIMADKLRSADGLYLSETYTKRFFVSDRDRQRPETISWQIKTPEAASTEPLRVNFNDQLDYLTALHGLLIYKDSLRVSGEISLEQNEQIWLFHPKEAWKTGNYRIVVNPNIEDHAGNNLTRLFDTDLNAPLQETNTQFELTFIVK